jgi:hypothetical protein
MRVVQWILALVFAITAGLKVATIVQSTRGGAVASVTMFSSLSVAEQWAVVAAEMVLAVWLATGWRTRWGAFAAISMLSIFMGAVIVEMGKPIPHPCGCFGALSTGSPLRGLRITLAADVLLILGALWVYFKARPRAPGCAGPNHPAP